MSTGVRRVLRYIDRVYRFTGDIHRVRNSGAGIAVWMHIYGADLSRLGSSIRRIYDLPLRWSVR